MRMMLYMNLMEKNFAVKGENLSFVTSESWKIENISCNMHKHIMCIFPLYRVTIEHARARSRGGRGRGRYSDRFSSRRPRNDRRYVMGEWLI
jgi:hypothetical protein